MSVRISGQGSVLRKKIRQLLLLPLGIWISACGQPSDSASLQELESLRREIRAVKQLTHEVRAIERQLEDVKQQLSRSERSGDDNAPITARSYQPNGSERDDPFLGSKDAPVLVMAFSDFECGPCRSFHEKTLPRLKSDYIARDLVKFVVRDFPLANHRNALKAAAAAHCAGEQGKYWEMFDLLFKSQERVRQGEILEAASELKSVEQEKLKQCVESGRYGSEVDQDISDGIQLGAKGVPGFFVGENPDAAGGTQPTAAGHSGRLRSRGVFIRGAQPYAVIRAEILKILDQKVSRAKLADS